MATITTTARTDIADCDLAQGLRCENGVRILAVSDSEAHIFGAKLYNGADKISLSDDSFVNGHFVRADGVTVVVGGSKETADGTALVKVTLTDNCYTVPGRFTLSIQVCQDGVYSTVRLIEGCVYTTISNRIIENESAAVSISDVISLLDMKLNAPIYAGTAGNVLVTDGQGGTKWESPSASTYAGSVVFQSAPNTRYPLRIGTGGQDGYITFVLEE